MQMKVSAVDSTLYNIQFQENVDLGELMFSLCYLPTAGRLTITMIKARNLKAMDITGASGGFWKHSGVRPKASSFPIIPGWSQPRFLGQIHTWRFPWCAKAGGWRRERRRRSGTLWTPCTTRPSCSTFLQRTSTRSACSSPLWTTIG